MPLKIFRKKTGFREKYENYRRDPVGVSLSSIQEMAKRTKVFTDDLIKKVTEQTEKSVQEEIEKAILKLEKEIEKLIDQKGDISEKMLAKLTQIKGEKGDRGEKGFSGKDGKTPEIFVDYFTHNQIEEMIRRTAKLVPIPKDGKDGINGVDGKTPIAGMDYPTEDQIKTLIIENTPKISEKDIIDKLEKKLDNKFEKITNLIEELREEIKKQKAIPAYGNKKLKGAAHGGGDIVNTYDLTSFTNGTLKVFTVPIHLKALFVIGADYPTVLIQNNGFTVNAARTEITLTSDPAPSSGSQLLFVYAQ